ncbi:MAG: cell division protein SepF [bacterium]|nr:cell division protein SepF [bacterium]
MGLIKLPNLFSVDDEDAENEVMDVKETSKSSNKEYKNKTILVEPRAFSEAQQIADYLKAKNQVVVNFKRVTSDVSKRIMDFLNGIIYAIEGTMQKLGPGIVICAPKGFEIEGNISEDENKKSTKKDDLTDW